SLFQTLHENSTCSAHALVSLVLLVLIPSGDTLPLALLPRLVEAGLLQHKASLGAPSPAAMPPVWEFLPEPEHSRMLVGEVLERGWNQAFRRGLHDEFGKRPLGTLPEGFLNALHYPDASEEGGEKRNDALNSIAGGLQAFNRQKGGFGFRFGRK
uniref:Pyroglutamylated RFamide peptide n=1 Tax=Denticeps clupeoides TaxID=299321 RepID=A0AAY4BW73_9TELE